MMRITSYGVTAALLVLATSQMAGGQSTPTTDALGVFTPLIGTWQSHLDPKYRDHPAIKRFNPDMKPQQVTFSWGVGRKVIHVRFTYIDRPGQGDRTQYIEGIVAHNPVTGEILFLAYNAVDDQLYDGVYDFGAPKTIERRYTAYVAGGSAGTEFRDVWEWTSAAQTSFNWFTDTLMDGAYQRSDIVLRWDKQASNDES